MNRLRCIALSIGATGLSVVAAATTVVAIGGAAAFTIGGVAVPVAYATYVAWVACVSAKINATVCWATLN